MGNCRNLRTSIVRSLLIGSLSLGLAFNNLQVSRTSITAASEMGFTYYVDGANGSDSNSGISRDQAWRTIQKAANTIVAGDTTTILPGKYYERIRITRSGTSGAPITFQAEGSVITRGFTIIANYISVFGFEISDTPNHSNDGWGIYVEGSYCDIEENYIHSTLEGGISIYSDLGREAGTSYCLVRNNRLYRNTLAGIVVYGRNNLIEGNEIWGTIQYSPGYGDADGIRFFGSGHIIRANYIHDISYGPENTDPHIDCFQTWAGGDREVGHDIAFERNVCINLEAHASGEVGQGFMIEDANHLTIRNNIIRAYRIVNAHNSSYLKIENNTFTNDLSLPLNYHPFMIDLGETPYVVIRNNIMYDPEAHVLIADDQSGQGLDVGYNCVYRSDGQNPEGYPYPHDLWQVNPLLVNPGANDFHLLPTSPMINAGITTDYVVDDFDGFPRPLGFGFDIGAYEFPYRISTNPPIVHKNDTLSITIFFGTNGQPVTITSTLPIQLDYLSSTATCPATVTYSNLNRTVTYTGNPLPALDCNLQIFTQVNTDQKVSVTMSTTIDNDLLTLQKISKSVILNGLPHYLTLIQKKR